tara:strand:+ start:85 stop:510 length:426 start_codon:yes stop_codon:yes gene_type:complete
MKFENKDNKLREQEALQLFSNNLGLTFKKHSEYAHIDAALYNKGNLIGFAEVKGVHKSIDTATDVIVSMRKIVRGQSLQVQSTKPVVIIWAFNDALVYERINNLKGVFYHGGRAARKGSTYDQEQLIKVLIKNLKRIEKIS